MVQIGSINQRTPEQPKMMRLKQSNIRGATTSASSSATSSSSNASASLYMPSPEEKFLMKELLGTYREPSPESTYLVTEERLRCLFRRCQECGAKIQKDVRLYRRGGHLRVETFCDVCCKEIDWHNFPCINGMSWINLMIPAATITAGKTYDDVKKIADGCHLSIISKRQYHYVANAYIYPEIHSFYKEAEDEILSNIREKQQADPHAKIQIAMDTRYSRPGHTATFATTSALDVESKKIISSITTTKLIDSTSSSGLELEGTKIILNSLLRNDASVAVECEPEDGTGLQANVGIRTVVTDDHSSIIKMMRDKYSGISHQGDVWHFVKRVKARLIEASRKKDCGELAQWIKSITNFIWTISQECFGDEDLLEELWFSILYHVNGQHTWAKKSPSDRLEKCLHDPISEEKQKEVAWLSRSSNAYKALRLIVLDRRLIISLRRCSNFLHTSELESFHSTILKFAPKRISFDEGPFKSRVKLAILDFNENIGRSQQLTSSGEPAARLELPLSTRTWTLKSKLVNRTDNWRRSLLSCILMQRHEASATSGHRVAHRTLRTEPTQASMVRLPPMEQLRREYLKRRKYEDRLELFKF